LTSAVEHVV